MAAHDEGTKKTRKVIDWEAVEIQYRAGIRSLKDIGTEFDVSDAGILKRAKRDGWVRDLKAKIQAKADAKVSASLVSGEVSARTKAAEADVIEAEATTQATIRLSHRTDIAKSRKLVMTLLQELELQTDNIDLLERLSELVCANEGEGEPTKSQQDAQAKRMELFNKVISLGSRSGTMKSLAESLKNLIALEREAYGISGGSGLPDNKAPAGLSHFYGEQ